MTEITLTLTGKQHLQLKAHLSPGDGNEAVAIALCGRRAGERRHRLLVRSLHFVPQEACTERTNLTVAWPTDIMVPWLEEADRRGLSVVKIHSHPGDDQRFSAQDDASDFALFPCIADWIEAEVPHASAVMLPDGRMFGRAFTGGPEPQPLASVMVVGDDLLLWHHNEFDGQPQTPLPAFTQRHAQAFGDATTRRLRRISAAVIGASGTGSIVIEQLMRLGIGCLVIVDDDIVKDLNLNRILNATAADANAKQLKVDVADRTIKATGLDTEVEVYASNLKDRRAIRAVAQCDLLFGCVDSAEGRFVANQVAAFYLLPYIDVGVALDADDLGAITQVCGYVHYLQPGLSSLVSRGAVAMDDVNAEALRRQSRSFYDERRKVGYINNVVEDRPAVISVNTVLAGLAVNELLARVHGFRDEPNGDYGSIGVSISQVMFYPEPESRAPCRILARHAGRGDVEPLLEQPELSDSVA